MWSKNATGRPGNGVSVHAKLNSPKPTPAHGCRRISASVFDQMPQRELEMSPLVLKRVSPPNTWWLCSAQAAVPTQHTAYATGASSSSARACRDRRLSSRPHTANRPTLTAPVRDALSTTTNTNSSAITCPTQRRSTPVSASHSTATNDHSSRLLRWLGWRMLPTARPSM